MVIDYSKWDKLELSDDSDIEVHPNVDKKSFIRWKQRDIHDRREQMKARMAQLELNEEMNTDLKTMLDQLIKGASDESISTDVGASVLIATHAVPKKRPSRADHEGGPQYADMIESLLLQIKAQISPGSEDEELLFVEKVREHRDSLQKALDQDHKEYLGLVEERSRHIVSEDMHTGFDSTLINKSSDASKSKHTASSSSSNNSSSIAGQKGANTEVEVLNNPSVNSSTAKQEEGKEEEEEDADSGISASNDAKEFAKIPLGSYRECYQFVRSHEHIVSEKEKDGLMMVAFDQQLAGDSEGMERTVHNALLLQYSLTIGKAALDKLFDRLANLKHPAHEAFMKDVKLTVDHIKSRCELIKSEQGGIDEEGVEQIQLHAVDPDTEILVRVPQPGDEGYDVYLSLSKDLKAAIEQESLAEINKVLADMSVEEAEDVVKKFDECGVLMIEEKIYDQGEWEEKKKELERLEQLEEEDDAVQETPGPKEPEHVSSVDDVD